MAYLITPSTSVPVGRRLVNEAARPLIPSSNPQVANPPWPILLYDRVTVKSAGDAAFRSDAFRNNTSRPIELHSMRVGTVFTDLPDSFFFRSGGIIALSIAVDGVPVTNGAVPIWMMCRSDNRRPEEVTPASSFDRGVTFYAWHFSQPVQLMPGKSIEVSCQHRGITSSDARVGVSFAGRVSPAAIPKRIPYVCAWTSRAFDYAEVATESAPPAAMINDTGRDLHVDRIIGRAFAYDDGSPLQVGMQEFVDFNDYSRQSEISFFTRFGLSYGRPILKVYTPWAAVFAQDASIETDFIMRAKDYLMVDVQHQAGPTFAPVSYVLTFSKNRASVSLVGWREV